MQNRLIFGSFLINISYCVEDIGHQGEPKDPKSGNKSAGIISILCSLLSLGQNQRVTNYVMTQVTECCDESALEPYEYAVIVF